MSDNEKPLKKLSDYKYLVEQHKHDVTALRARVAELEIVRDSAIKATNQQWDAANELRVAVTSLLAERNRLRKELIRLDCLWANDTGELGGRTCSDDARCVRCFSESERDALKEDAERYRWLRERGFNVPDLPYKRQTFNENVAEIEAAIDVDRLASEEEDDE